MSEQKALGEKIRTVREAAGMTQKDLAEALWGDRDQQGSVSQIENGKADIRASTITKIAAALGVEPGTLI